VPLPATGSIVPEPPLPLLLLPPVVMGELAPLPEGLGSGSVAVLHAVTAPHTAASASKMS